MKLLDNRKPFSPIPAAAMPVTTNATFGSSRSSLFIDSVLIGSPLIGSPVVRDTGRAVRVSP